MRRTSSVLAAVVAVVALAGCGSSPGGTATSKSPSASPSPSLAAFQMPRKGDPIGVRMTAPPRMTHDEAGAYAFSAYFLNLVDFSGVATQARVDALKAVVAPTCRGCAVAVKKLQRAVRTRTRSVAKAGKTSRFVSAAGYYISRKDHRWHVYLNYNDPGGKRMRGSKVVGHFTAVKAQLLLTLSWTAGHWRVEQVEAVARP